MWVSEEKWACVDSEGDGEKEGERGGRGEIGRWKVSGQVGGCAVGRVGRGGLGVEWRCGAEWWCGEVVRRRR